MRYLKGRRGVTSAVSVFSVVGLMLGVGALMVVMAVMSGFRAELLNRILGMTGHAILTEPNLDLPRALDLQKLLIEKNLAISAVPYVLGQAMVISPVRATGAVVRGLQVADMPDMLRQNITSGALSNLSTSRTVAIGSSMARNLGVEVGDTITLLSPEGTSTIIGFIPRMVPVRVGAVFDVGMQQYDSALVVMDLPTAQSFMRLGNWVHALDVRVHQPDEIDAIASAIISTLNAGGSLVPWMENNRQFFNALRVERIVMFIILSLIVLVAAFNIITSQTMLVGDKTADIAILRTFGATRTQILRIFLINGILLGGLGIISGLIAGSLVIINLQSIARGIEWLFGVSVFSGDVYYLEKIPTVVEPLDIAFIIGMAFVLTILASLYPAWRASKLNPVDILRHA